MRNTSRGVDLTKPNATAFDCSDTCGAGTTPASGALEAERIGGSS